MCEELKVFEQLKMYVGHKVQFDKLDEVTFVYQNFQLDLHTYTNVCVIYDEENSDCKLHIPLFGLNEINFKGTDLYDGITEIDSCHHNWFITCLDEKKICYKCDCQIKDYDQIWSINQFGGYNSNRDGKHVKVDICNNCFNSIFTNTVKVGVCNE